jgi:hypothetical protein
VVSPSADDFAALARSSPWRWSTLRFTTRWWPRVPAGREKEPVRAWVRRPDLLRVETLDGRVLRIVREQGRPGPADPVLRPDGLVAERPRGPGVEDFDTPFYENYFWTAMLDPVELADGNGTPAAPGVSVDSVTETEHHGRPAWEAVVRTTQDYLPRCACCALLWSRESDLLEFGPEGLRDDYPEAYRVRLDVGTGVCVLTEELDGSPRGYGHELRIEAADGPMADALFQ